MLVNSEMYSFLCTVGPISYGPPQCMIAFKPASKNEKEMAKRNAANRDGSTQRPAALCITGMPGI